MVSGLDLDAIDKFEWVFVDFILYSLLFDPNEMHLFRW